MSQPKLKRQPERDATFHTGSQHAGQTLSAVLRDLLLQEEGLEVSWGQVKKWILARHVLINGNLCMDDARRVTDRDVIKLLRRAAAKPVDVGDIRIAHLDEDLIIVEKPAGVTSVRHAQQQNLSDRRRQLQPTLDELVPPVLAKMQRLPWPPPQAKPAQSNQPRSRKSRQNAPELPPKPLQRRKKPQAMVVRHLKNLPPELQAIPVHRLDRDTSGLMVFARHPHAEQRLAAMFRRHTISREYFAVCIGEVNTQTVSSYLVRDRGDGLRGSLPPDADKQARAKAQVATTHIIASESFGRTDQHPGYSLIRLRLETGRTHQIRIHLAELGNMLCGEKTYQRGIDGSLTSDSSGAPRHALHSDRLTFTHPFTGEQMRFEMPLPADLTGWLTRLREQLPR